MSQVQVLGGGDPPCLCGSQKPLRTCCLQADGNLRVILPRIEPPGPTTNNQTEGCYLASTLNCAGFLNREHYISEVVLAEMGSKVRIGGMPWLKGGEPKDVGISALTSKVLCERHNASLTHLDHHAGAFMRLLKSINQDINQFKSLADVEPLMRPYLMSGEILERWMLKVLLGLYFSKNVVVEGEQPALDQFPIDMDRVLAALYKGDWGPRCGLYVAYEEGEEVKSALNFEAKVLCDLSKNMVYGVRVVMHGITFFLIIDDLDGNVEINDSTTLFRPSNFRYVLGPMEQHLLLTWALPPSGDARGITLTRTCT